MVNCLVLYHFTYKTVPSWHFHQEAILHLALTALGKKKSKRGRDNCYQIMRGTDLDLINSALKYSRTSEMLSCLLRCSSSYALKEQSCLVPKGSCLTSHLLRFLPGCSSKNWWCTTDNAMHFLAILWNTVSGEIVQHCFWIGRLQHLEGQGWVVAGCNTDRKINVQYTDTNESAK